MNAHSKALLILSPGFPANEADTACLPFPQLFVKTLKELQPSLKVIVLAFQYPFVKSCYQWHNVQVISFGGSNKGKLSRLLVWKAVWKKINRIAKEYSVVGILNFWLGECGLLGKYAARKHAVPFFTWLLGQDARANNRYFSLIKPTGHQLIALSDFIAAEMERNYHVRPANIIPPGIDLKNKPIAGLTRDIDLLGAGSLIPLKQYDVFIRIVSKLTAYHPKLKAVICGKGGEQNRLQKMITEAGLSANVGLCGELEHDAVIALMQRAKIFLHPSAYEGYGVVMAEALYAGAHVVAFYKPMNNVYRQQHIVQTEDEMAATVNALLNDCNRRQESILTASIEFSCKKVLQLFGM